MKKIFLALAVMAVCSFFATAEVKYEVGLGSGYIFYGDKDLRSVLDDFDQKSQMILTGDYDFNVPVGNMVRFAAGVDSILDARWRGSNRIILWDYCGYFGFDVFPCLAGLYGSINYCLGRRSDYISLTDDDSISSTPWGNGFSFGIGYDFGYDSGRTSPEVAALWRHMPRGHSSDNIIEVKLRLKM